MAKSKQTQSDKLTIEVQKRDVVGKRIRKLRKEGVLPANIFGPDFKSQAISLNPKEFTKVYKNARETGVVYVKLGTDEIPTLIRNVQQHPVKEFIMHVDFRKIDLTQKIETTVPVEFVGTSIAVSQLGGVLLKQADHINLSALPQNIPQHLEVDISSIKEIGGEIKVKDLAKSDKYEVIDEPEKVIVSVVEHKVESETPETTAAAPEVITEKKEGEEGASEAPTAEAPAKEEKK